MQRSSQSLMRCLKSSLAALLALLLLALTWLASNEAVHFKLHGASSHHGTCAVCAVAKGLVDAPLAVATFVGLDVALLWSLPRTESAFIPESDFPVTSSRGPPAVVSPL